VLLWRGASSNEGRIHSHTSAAQTAVGPNTAGPPPCAVHGLEEEDDRYIVDVSGDPLLRDGREVFTIGANCVMADAVGLCMHDRDSHGANSPNNRPRKPEGFATVRACHSCAQCG